MTFAILTGTAGVLAAFERLPRWRFQSLPLFRPYFVSDAIYLLTGYVAGSSLAIAYVLAVSELAARLGLPSLGPPWWLAVALALVALDLGNYTAHWLLHRVDVLWEFHKVHHSSPALDWLAAFRSHLVEQALRRLIAPLPLVLLGLPIHALIVAGGLFYAWAALDHANLRVDLGFLEPVLVTPRLHRLHHLPRTTERNLGTVLTVWDRLLGKLVVAETRATDRCGIPGEMEGYPQDWLRQLVEPVRRLSRWAG